MRRKTWQKTLPALQLLLSVFLPVCVSIALKTMLPAWLLAYRSTLPHESPLLRSGKNLTKYLQPKSQMVRWLLLVTSWRGLLN
jgi:hypothetical protein